MDVARAARAEGIEFELRVHLPGAYVFLPTLFSSPTISRSDHYSLGTMNDQDVICANHHGNIGPYGPVILLTNPDFTARVGGCVGPTVQGEYRPTTVITMFLTIFPF